MNSKILQTSFIAFFLLINTSFALAGPSVPKPDKQFYQLIVYHIGNKTQEQRLDKYLAEAYLPAAHRLGITTIGVFKTANIDRVADKRIYVLLPYSSLHEYHEVANGLNADQELIVKGSDYVNAAHNNAPYIRKESILMEAFSGMPTLKVPDFTSPKSKRIYELRSYESATEKLYLNKVQMFNEGEIDIFNKIGSQAVFYGQVLMGSAIPNLMYMTTYSDKTSRDEHWDAFRSHPEWKRMSAFPEYQHNTSRSDIILLTPTEYSDL